MNGLYEGLVDAQFLKFFGKSVAAYRMGFINVSVDVVGFFGYASVEKPVV